MANSRLKVTKYFADIAVTFEKIAAKVCNGVSTLVRPRQHLSLAI